MWFENKFTRLISKALMDKHHENTLKVIKWLSKQEKVKKIAVDLDKEKLEKEEDNIIYSI